MAAKTDGPQQKVLSEFQKNFLELLTNKLGFNVTEIDKVKLSKVSTDDYYTVIYNFMGTGIHIPAKDVDESEYIREGFGIWRTCSYVW